MITNVNLAVGARGIVGAVPRAKEYTGPTAFPTQPYATPNIVLTGLPGGPSFGYRERTGEGIVAPPPRDRLPRLWYPNIKTNLAGRHQFSTKQSASEVYLPPVVPPFRGATVAAVRNRNVLRPSASSSFIPSVFISPGRRT